MLIRVGRGAGENFQEDVLRARHNISLDAPIHGHECSMAGSIEGREDRSLEINEAAKQVADAMRCLTESDRYVMQCRLAGLTLEEIAERRSVTRERIRQIEDRAMTKMARYLYRCKQQPVHAKSVCQAPVRKLTQRPVTVRVVPSPVIAIRRRRTRQTGDTVATVVLAHRSQVASGVARRVLDAVSAAFAGRR